jgi:CRISPR-associated protein Cas1
VTVLYVTEQGVRLTRRGDSLAVQKGTQILERVPLADLEQVAILGYAQLTTQALRALLQRGVEVLLCTAGGALVGRLASSLGKNIALRRAQFAHLGDEGRCLDLARRVVSAKLFNQQNLVRRYHRRLQVAGLAEARVAIRVARERVSEATTLDELRGLEGHAAARYFGAFGLLASAPGMEFTRRARRPPPDPVNILLSFGYTQLTNAMHGLVEAASLDPYLGALHAPVHGRPSLALDLIEPFRPLVVDATVLRVVNSRRISPEDFSDDDAGHERMDTEGWEPEAWPDVGAPALEVWPDAEAPGAASQAAQRAEDAAARRYRLRFRREGIRKWVTAYEQRLSDRVYHPGRQARLTYRQVLREEVYALAAHLRDGVPFEPFLAPT